MMLIRPIEASDFAVLKQIAIESGAGFTSLPVDDAILEGKIARSCKSFAAEVEQPHDEYYLLVLEDTDTGAVVGTTAIEAAVGTHDPFYHYHLGKVVHSSRELGVYNVVETLTLTNDYTGVSELCTLFLQERYRHGYCGRLLSKVRFLLMAEFPQRFHEMVIAEMRGVTDDKIGSPFWQWLQDHFFTVDYTTADRLTGMGRKEFIAELMPKYPVYVSLLSKAAQAVIGKVHPQTVPALKLLQQEGFSCRGYVDIFDAGPTVECPLENIKSVQRSYRLKAVIGQPLGGRPCLISNCKLPEFRATVAEVTLYQKAHQVVVSADVAARLAIANGDAMRVLVI